MRDLEGYVGEALDRIGVRPASGARASLLEHGRAVRVPARAGAPARDVAEGGARRGPAASGCLAGLRHAVAADPAARSAPDSAALPRIGRMEAPSSATTGGEALERYRVALLDWLACAVGGSRTSPPRAPRGPPATACSSG